MSTRGSSSLCLALVLAWSSLGRAESPDERTAELLFQQGRELLQSEDYSPACEKLEQSQKLDPAPGTLILLAFCHEKMGRYASAYREYREAGELAHRRGDQEKTSAAQRFAEKVRGKQHVLVVILEQRTADVELWLDGDAVRISGKQMEMALDPGAHAVRASSRAGQWERGVRIPTTPGRTILNVPALGSKASTARSEEGSWWSENALALGALGAGVVGVGVGSFFGLRAFDKNDESKAFCDSDQHCEPRGRELRDQARTSAMISNIGFGVGILGIATGSVMLLAKPASSPVQSGFAFGGRF